VNVLTKRAWLDRALKALLIVVIAWAAWEHRENRATVEAVEKRNVQVDQISIDDRKELHRQIEELRRQLNGERGQRPEFKDK
jgi:uncharacterized membrane protein (DUF2068 family)